jgi:ActR/RegA family two-component response regulator/DNA-binding HxlR family transcriptional regulator
MRILIVDDDGQSLEDTRNLLTHRGHSVNTASSVRRATLALEQQEFDILFTDIRIGRTSGLTLLQKARAAWPRMLVVMLTGKATMDSAIRALQLGAFDYLRKPTISDQIDRVLELARQQLALTRTGARQFDAGRYASRLAVDGGYEVLLIASPSVKISSPSVIFLPLREMDLSSIRDAIEDFIAPRTRCGVVVASVDRLLAHHREEEVARLLGKLRAMMEAKGPLAIGYDPCKITATGALAVRASIVSADAHLTLECLANPIRRMVLLRLREGTCSFTQAMESAHVVEDSLIAFHLRKLTESGLIGRIPRQGYGLTDRGKGVITILRAIDELDSGKGSGNRIFELKPSIDATLPHRRT